MILPNQCSCAMHDLVLDTHLHCTLAVGVCLTVSAIMLQFTDTNPVWACRAISQAQAGSLLRMWERDVMLGTLDDLWLQYLLETQRLQRAVNLRCNLRFLASKA